MRNFTDAKLMAKSLRAALKVREVAITHADALEIVAAQFGFDDWNVLSAKIGAGQLPAAANDVAFQPARPILRIFDEAKAKEFYLDFLGFTLDWEHRFGDNFPLYAQVSRAGLALHLSGHHGDASPGSNLVVPMQGLDKFQAELKAKDYTFLKPGITDNPWGRQMEITDPFHNRIRFVEKP